MQVYRLLSACISLAVLSGCEPGAVNSSADYERHKSNREAYMYQGR